MILMDFNKYESYIRVGHSGRQTGTDSFGQKIYVSDDLQDFPTPQSLGRVLHDVDKDAYTDLRGYTHRNRVRHDVEDVSIGYGILSSNDENYILNRISPEWIYVELTDKKTKEKRVHKMYASDKQWDTSQVAYDPTQKKWVELDNAFQFSLVEE